MARGKALILIPPGPTVGGNSVYRPVLPRGALLVADSLALSGWDVSVYDGYSNPGIINDVLEGIHGDPPEVVGVSCHGAPSLSGTKRILDFIRSQTDIPLIVGGYLPTIAPDFVAELVPRRTLIVSGDIGLDSTAFERARELPNAIEQFNLGLSEHWPLPSLKTCLYPSLSSYCKAADFEYHLETQRGCPYRCFHCGTGQPGLVARTAYRPVESLLAELERVTWCSNEAGNAVPNLWITDETFLSNETHVQGVCEALAGLENPFRWRAQSRPDTVSRELIRIMKNAGCRTLAMGVEITSDDGLKLLGKTQNMSQVSEAFRLCHEEGMDAEAIVVFGTPRHRLDPKALNAALQALRVSSIQSYIYHPAINSPWWKRFGSELTQQAGWWDRLDFHSPPIQTDQAPDAVREFLAFRLYELEERPQADPIFLPEARQECHSCSRTFLVETEEVYPGVAMVVSQARERTLYLSYNDREALLYEHRHGATRNILMDTYELARGDPALRNMNILCPFCPLSLAGEGEFANLKLLAG